MKCKGLLQYGLGRFCFLKNFNNYIKLGCSAFVANFEIVHLKACIEECEKKIIVIFLAQHFDKL